MSKEGNKSDSPGSLKDKDEEKDKDKSRKIILKAKSDGKKRESESNNSDKASRVKLTPSKQVLQSSLDTPINQSVLDILGISPSPIKNKGADSKGEKRKGSGNEDSTHSD